MSFDKVELVSNHGNMSEKWKRDLKTFSGAMNAVEKATKGTNKVGVSHPSGAMGKKR